MPFSPLKNSKRHRS